MLFVHFIGLIVSKLPFIALHYALLRGACPPNPSILPLFFVHNALQLKGIVLMLQCPLKCPSYTKLCNITSPSNPIFEVVGTIMIGLIIIRYL